MKNQSSGLLRGDLFRLLRSPKFYIAFATGLLLLLHPLFSSVWRQWSYYTPIELLSFPLAASDFSPFAVIFCVLPFADSFCEDFNSQYVSNIVIRVGARKYARHRCLFSALTGGCVMGCLMLITVVLCSVAAGKPDTIETVSFMQNSIWWKMEVLLPYNGIIMYVLKIVLAVLFGMLWALVGLTISTFIPNPYVTLIAPFVLYQILWFSLSETPINPVYLLRGDSNFIPSFGFAIFRQLVCIALCSFITYCGICRMVKK